HSQLTRDGKNILRKAMVGLLPDDVIKGPKRGFSGPDASWFRGKSLGYVNDLLMTPEARIYQFLQPGYVQGRIGRHLRGERNERLFIWSMLCLEWWIRIFLDKETVPCAA
ncbi:hypothetical protein LCGC14_3141990, partial [marine sediment metagenome]